MRRTAAEEAICAWAYLLVLADSCYSAVDIRRIAADLVVPEALDGASEIPEASGVAGHGRIRDADQAAAQDRRCREGLENRAALDVQDLGSGHSIRGQRRMVVA